MLFTEMQDTRFTLPLCIHMYIIYSCIPMYTNVYPCIHTLQIQCYASNYIIIAMYVVMYTLFTSKHRKNAFSMVLYHAISLAIRSLSMVSYKERLQILHLNTIGAPNTSVQPMDQSLSVISNTLIK